MTPTGTQPRKCPGDSRQDAALGKLRKKKRLDKTVKFGDNRLRVESQDGATPHLAADGPRSGSTDQRQVGSPTREFPIE